MPWIVLEGARPYDGRYQLDLTGVDFTTREWGWIKRLAGYLPVNIEEGWVGGDPELFAVLAVIAVRRSGKVDQRDVPDLFNRLVDAPFGTTIRLEFDETDNADDEDDVRPPAPSSSVNEPSSGDASTTSSETSPVTRDGSGTPGSDTSESTPIRLAT